MKEEGGVGGSGGRVGDSEGGGREGWEVVKEEGGRGGRL